MITFRDNLFSHILSAGKKFCWFHTLFGDLYCADIHTLMMMQINISKFPSHDSLMMEACKMYELFKLKKTMIGKLHKTAVSTNHTYQSYCVNHTYKHM